MKRHEFNLGLYSKKSECVQSCQKTHAWINSFHADRMKGAHVSVQGVRCTQLRARFPKMYMGIAVEHTTILIPPIVQNVPRSPGLNTYQKTSDRIGSKTHLDFQSKNWLSTSLQKRTNVSRCYSITIRWAQQIIWQNVSVPYNYKGFRRIVRMRVYDIGYNPIRVFIFSVGQPLQH